MAENEIECKSKTFVQDMAHAIEQGRTELAQEAFTHCSYVESQKQVREAMANQPIKTVIPGIGDLYAGQELIPSIRQNWADDVAALLHKDGYAGKFEFKNE